MSSSKAIQPRLTRGDGLVGLLVLAVTFAFFGCWFPSTQYGDGPQLLSLISSFDFGPAIYRHAGYLPGVIGFKVTLQALHLDVTPGLAAQLGSAFTGALGLAGCYWLARLLGSSRSGACGSIALFAASPVVSFFCRVVEVHAPHFAAVALTLVGLVWLSPRSRVGTFAWLVVAGAVLFLTHQSAVLLFPGLGLCAGLYAPNPRLKRVWAWTAVALSLALVVGIAATLAVRSETLGQLLGGTQDQVENDQRGAYGLYVWTNLIVPLGLGWPLIVLGLRRLSKQAVRLVWIALLLCLPEVVFFTAWAVPERGAYIMGYLPILIAVGAFAFSGGQASPREVSFASKAKHLAVLVPALIIQVALSSWLLMVFQRTNQPDFQRTRFASVAAALSDESGPKVLLTLEPTLQSPCARIDNLFERKLIHEVATAVRTRVQPAVFASQAAAGLRAVESYRVVYGAAIYFDRTFWAQVSPQAPFAAYAKALEQAIRDTFQVTALADDKVWRLEALTEP